MTSCCRIWVTSLLLYPTSVKQTTNTNSKPQLCPLPRLPVYPLQPLRPEQEGGVCPQLSCFRTRRQVQNGATATSWHRSPSQAYLLTTRPRTLSVPWKFPCLLIPRPILSLVYMHTHAHVHTQTHTVIYSSQERRLERQAARETTHSCLTFVFVSPGRFSVVAEHLTTQIFTSVGSYCPCWTWPPVDRVLSSVKKVREVKNPFSSASFFNLTVASKASYSPLFELLQTQSLNLFRPLIPNYN